MSLIYLIPGLCPGKITPVSTLPEQNPPRRLKVSPANHVNTGINFYLTIANLNDHVHKAS